MVRKKQRRHPLLGRFLFIGGQLCVDFANTVYAPGKPDGALGVFDDVVAFLEAAGAVDPGKAGRLRTLAQQGPRRSQTAFTRTLALRTMLRALLAAIEAREPVGRQWVECVNTLLRSDLGYSQLVARDERWALTSVTSRENPLSVLVPVAHSAAELLQEGPGAPVRKCANPTCLLYFYDGSRSGKRRWCSMAVCGNRMKVAAFARRKRAVN